MDCGCSNPIPGTSRSPVSLLLLAASPPPLYETTSAVRSIRTKWVHDRRSPADPELPTLPATRLAASSNGGQILSGSTQREPQEQFQYEARLVPLPAWAKRPAPFRPKIRANALKSISIGLAAANTVVFSKSGSVPLPPPDCWTFMSLSLPRAQTREYALYRCCLPCGPCMGLFAIVPMRARPALQVLFMGHGETSNLRVSCRRS